MRWQTPHLKYRVLFCFHLPRSSLAIDQQPCNLHSAEHALAIAPGRTRRVRGTDLIVPCDLQSLRRGYIFVFQTVWMAAMENTNAFHGQQLYV
jgi:hypothetical protein